MSNNSVDIARAMKDQAYFDGLTEEEKEIVRAASPVGASELSNDDLESVSGGLEGGDAATSTTTTTDLKQCSCGGGSSAAAVAGDCGCVC